MLPKQYRLPEQPLALGERVKLSDGQRAAAQELANRLSEAVGGLPVVLAQRSEVVCAAEGTPREVARRLARQVARAWQPGDGDPARERIRFGAGGAGGHSGPLVGASVGREATEPTVLYSAHVTGALTLTVAWQPDLSLTQVRAETLDVRRRLEQLLEPE